MLYDDATTLRPLRAGSEWTYRGRDRLAQETYFSAVRHGPSASGVEETADRVLNSVQVDKQAVDGVAGSVVATQALYLFGSGSGEPIVVTELRSPVRQNDEYTLFERTIAKSGEDIDGDAIEDSVDLAAYAKVIGNEDVTLADQTTISALRVNVTASRQFRRSSDNVLAPARRVMRSTWYASGIGVVRRSLITATAGNTDSADIDEVLVNWDGVVAGRGYTSPERAFKPASSTSSAKPLPPLAGIAGFEDHALVLTNSVDPFDPSGVALTVLDQRGKLRSIVQYPGLMLATHGDLAQPGVWFRRLGSGAVLLSTFGIGSSKVNMIAFNGEGQLASGADGVVLPLSINEN